MTKPNIEIFDTAPDESRVDRITLENGGTRISLITWGASLQAFHIAGLDRSLVLGSPSLAAYLGPLTHSGAIVGRVANRIAGGQTMLDGRPVTLDRNENDRNCLHGGTFGASRRNWTIVDHGPTSATLTLRMADGESGFPGTLDVLARYEVEDDGALTLMLEGRTDAPTFCNLASHGYWTLDPNDGLTDHLLQVEADHYLPVDADLIPLGAPAPVADTRFDFRTPRPVKRPDDPLLDHNFCLRSGTGLRPACRLSLGDLHLDIASDAPGLQVYEGAHLNSGDAPTTHGHAYGPNAGMAIEPQYWPDAPNQPDYPDIRLNPGEVWRQVTRFHAYR